MTTSLRLCLAVVVGTGLGSAGAFAAQQASPRVQARPVPPPEPRVVSGNDVGFRVEGLDSQGNPRGTFVIRVRGQWVPVSETGIFRPAH